jgi:WD40 repeat protein
VVFSSDSRRLASVGWENRHEPAGAWSSRVEVMVWDAQTGKQLFRHEHHLSNWQFHNLTLSRDGRRLAWMTSGRTDPLVKVWDLATQRLLLELAFKDYSLDKAIFTPDGGRLLVKGSARYDPVVQVYDLTTGRELFSVAGHTGTRSTMALSEDGQRILTAGEENTVKVWEAASGQALLTLREAGAPCLLGGDSRQLITAWPGKGVKVWEATTPRWPGAGRKVAPGQAVLK